MAQLAACGGSTVQPWQHSIQAAEVKRSADTGYLYVANESGYGSSERGSVLVFSETENGNVAPLNVIAGSQTELSHINGIAVDSSGNVYVADTDQNAIVGFSAGSTGNVSPSVVISGSNTGLAWPIGLAIDDSGNLYVANCGSGCKSGLTAPGLLEFSAGSNGNVAPVRNISGSNTQLTRSNGVAWRGDVYVSQTDSIVVFDKSANGNVPPKRVISGSKTGLSNAWGVAGDHHYVFAGSCVNNNIERFRYLANGNVAPDAVIAGGKTKLSSCVDGLAFGARGGIYAVTINATPAIVGFHRTETGDARPIRFISGSQTQLTYPTFIFATPLYVPK